MFRPSRFWKRQQKYPSIDLRFIFEYFVVAKGSKLIIELNDNIIETNATIMYIN